MTFLYYLIVGVWGFLCILQVLLGEDTEHASYMLVLWLIAALISERNER